MNVWSLRDQSFRENNLKIKELRMIIFHYIWYYRRIKRKITFYHTFIYFHKVTVCKFECASYLKLGEFFWFCRLIGLEGVSDGAKDSSKDVFEGTLRGFTGIRTGFSEIDWPSTFNSKLKILTPANGWSLWSLWTVKSNYKKLNGWIGTFYRYKT